MAYTQKQRAMAATTPLGPDALLLVGFSGQDGLSQLFNFQLQLVAEQIKDVSFDKLLGQPVSVRMDLPGGQARFFQGICNRVSQAGSDGEFTGYRVEIVPKLWLLTRKAQSRIFQQQTVPDILKKVLQGIDASFELQGTFQPRDFCVQYRETDFNFASRLMEEEGIFYFFKFTADGHKMVIANTPQSHPDVPGSSKVIYETVVGGNRPEDRVHDWEKVQELRSGKYTVWDHCFELPHKHLEADKTIQDSVQVGTVAHKLKVGGNDQLEIYDYPGEYAQRFDGVAPGGGDRAGDLQKIFEDNKRTVELRMQQEALPSLIIRGTGNCRQFVSGHKFTLERHLNANGPYVITSVQHSGSLSGDFRSGGGSMEYQSSFTCIPAALPFRPARVAPKPVVQGSQTAVVAGLPTEEISTDKYGRVKVQFHWDREGKNNADSSCWIRVGTPWAGKQWGMIHIPRIGQEVIVVFQEGDPDQPIIVGSVYNADQMPPYKLPDNKTQSGIKSRSTLKGTPENFNEIRFEDLKGKEHIVIHAERNLNIQVEANERRTVGNNSTVTVGTNPKGDPKKNGKVTTTIFGDTSTTITKGDLSLDVQAGKMTEHVKGPVEQTYDDTLKTTVKNAITLTSTDANILIKAATEIKLECGASSITLKKDGTIEIKGKDIKINGTASVAVDSAKIDSVASATHTIKGLMVKINS